MRVTGSDRGTHLDPSVKPSRVRGGHGNGNAGLAANAGRVSQVDPEEFAQLKTDVGKILDFLSPKNGSPNGSAQAPAPAPDMGGAPPPPPAYAPPQGQFDIGKVSQLAELAKMLGGQTEGGGSLAEQMLLMSFKDQMDTNAILRRVALDRLTATPK